METVGHLFMQCHYTQSIWSEASKMIGKNVLCQSPSFDGTLNSYITNKDTKPFRDLPPILSWGI